jgi:hypothetical protein
MDSNSSLLLRDAAHYVQGNNLPGVRRLPTLFAAAKSTA